MHSRFCKSSLVSDNNHSNFLLFGGLSSADDPYGNIILHQIAGCVSHMDFTQNIFLLQAKIGTFNDY